MANTNVPDHLRAMWTDIYKLFDLNYQMQNTVEDWNKFWNQAKEIYEKHGKTDRLMDMITLVANMICDRMKADNKTPTWKPDENYPYPK